MAAAQMIGLVRHLKRVAFANEHAFDSDGHLVARLRSDKDADAFATLLHRHGPAVFAVCRRVLGNVHDAEDAFQATFLVLWHKASTLARPESVGSWLYGTAYYTARNFRASIQRRRMHEEKARHEAPANFTTSPLLAGEMQPLIEELARLPERFRTPLMLCDLQGKSRAEAGELLGWRAGTLSSRLARGRELLRTRLEKRGFQSSIGVLALASTREALRSNLPPALAAKTVRTISAWMAGDVALATKTAGQGLAMSQTILRGMAAQKAQTWAVCLVGALFFSGAGMLVRGNSLPLSAEPGAPPAARAEIDRRGKLQEDLYGDPLPAGAITRLGTVRLRPGNEVTAVAFSPDGTKLASGPIFANIVQIWDRGSGRLLQEFRGHHGTIMQIGFSPDAKHLFSSSLDKTVRVWNAATGNELRQFASPRPCKFTLTPDGRALALSNDDRAIHFWDIISGKETKVLKVGIEASIRPGFGPSPLAFSGDGKRLVTADSESLRLWDVEAGRLERSVENAGRGEPLAAGFTGGDVSVLSSAYGAPYTLWSLPMVGEPRILRVEPAKFAQFTFASGGESVLFASEGLGVRQWNTSTGAEISRFSGMRGDARSLAFSPDGKTAAAGTDGSTLHVWDLSTGKESAAPGSPSAAVDGVALSPAGDVAATVSANGELQAWDCVTGKKRWRRMGQAPLAPHSVAITPDGGKVLVGGLASGILVFDAADGKPLGQLESPDPAGVLGISADSQTLLTIHGGRTVTWRDLPTGRERSRFSARGESDIWSDYARRLLAGQRFHPPCLACSRDGRWAALGDQTELRCVHEEAPGKVRLALKTEINSISCLAFSPDAKHLAIAGDDPYVLLWDVNAGKADRQFDARGHTITALAFSPDGKLAVAGTSRGRILIWETASGRRIAQRSGHPSAIRQIVFTSDGALMASAGGTDTTALIWDVAALQE
jgi:RNA polymerase sigma factor (sigma-70 family)